MRFPLTSGEIDRLAGEVLDVDGRLLANHKIFTRTQLIAELAPRLYGRDPAELDRVLEHITASRGIVPLIGVTGAREQAYTTVEVLTAEATIAGVVETLTTLPGPTIDPDKVASAVNERERSLGRPLTRGQRQVVEQICGSGTAVSVVIGVAGSGKTTALDTVTTVLDRSGYRVLGTSTSGQAARTLATEAHLDATTFASLLWRLDHGHETLDSRTVVIVDETGMADDANLARLALAVQHAHASLVLVGDHRQLAAVGPGGALAALIDRHPHLTVTLDHNVRQHDPGERTALGELRDGSVATAIDWYATTGRIHTRLDRIETLAAMTDAWADDLTNGHGSALLAWRRTDVTDLNRLARHHWDQLGRLVGDDVEIAPGRWYAVGDQLVALAPNPAVGIVTSERLTVTAIDDHHLDAITSDGRHVHITGEGLDTDHLDYGYALTVHRAQGATHDRAHVLAAGGGRELAYVALSRAAITPPCTRPRTASTKQSMTSTPTGTRRTTSAGSATRLPSAVSIKNLSAPSLSHQPSSNRRRSRPVQPNASERSPPITTISTPARADGCRHRKARLLEPANRREENSMRPSAALWIRACGDGNAATLRSASTL